MSDDYLWDKSGAPDPEIEQLERLLGNLRYRRPDAGLPLPERAPVSSRINFRPAFAIAAAALFLMVAAGAWFALSQRNAARAPGMAATNAQPGTARDWLNPASISALNVQAVEEANERESHFSARNVSRSDKPRRSLESKSRARSDAPLASSSSTDARERISIDEGVAAREQLIKALHLASSKLNQLQKKIQDNKAAGPVS